MPTWLAIPLLAVLGLHVALGLVFASWFMLRGLARLDPTAAHAPLGFRLIIVPGVVALWPVLALRRRVDSRPERTP